MVSLDEAVIARLDKKEMHFEVLVDPYAAADLIDGKDVEIMQNLAIDSIFKDSKKGDNASEEAMEEAFGTTDVKEIAKKIILEGEIQLTTKQRKEMRETKEKKIIEIIARNAMDPRTKAPIPRDRIRLAMEEVGMHIDPFTSVHGQAKKIIDALRPVLPISTEKIRIAIKIPPQYTGRAYGEIRNFGELVKEEWEKDGSWIGIIELPAGRQGEFYDRMNELTKGEVETRIVK